MNDDSKRIAELDAINREQRDGKLHPATCGGGNRSDEAHRRYAEEHGDRDWGLLVATATGLDCPVCDYRQPWGAGGPDFSDRPGGRDLKPDNVPLAIGSTWTGPDGTVYAVVAPGDVGDRPRWWVVRGVVERLAKGWAWWGPKGPEDLHVVAANPTAVVDFALVLPRPASPLATPAQDGESELRAQIGTLSAELAFRLREQARVESELEDLRLEFGETRAQLESAQRACEACEAARDEAAKERDFLRRFCAGIELRISTLVQEHVDITSEAEPAMEGLLRIERALMSRLTRRNT